MLQDFSDGRSMTMFYFSIITVLQLQQQHIWSEAPVETKLYYQAQVRDFSGLEVACCPLVPKFVGSNLAEARAKKILSMPSFGGEVKPLVLWYRFAAGKRSLKCNMEVDI